MTTENNSLFVYVPNIQGFGKLFSCEKLFFLDRLREWQRETEIGGQWMENSFFGFFFLFSQNSELKLFN